MSRQSAPKKGPPLEKRLKKANTARINKDFVTALRHAEAGLKEHPGHAGLLLCKLNVLRDSGRAADALEFADAFKPSLRTGAALGPVVDLYLSENRLDEAEALVEDARRSDPPPPAYPVAALKCAESRNGPDAAISVGERLQAKFPRNAPLMMERSRLLKRTGRGADAIAVLEQAVAQTPTPGALHGLVQHRLDVAQYSEAHDLLQQHRALLSGSNWFYLLKAQVLQSLGNLPEAVETAREGVALFPGHALLNNALWRLLFAAGQHEEAGQSCRDFAARFPDNSPAQLQAARFLDGIGDRTAAADLLDKRLANAPEDTKLRSAAAQIALRRGDPAQALGISDTGLTYAPEDSGLLGTRLIALKDMGRTGEALELADSLAADRLDGPALDQVIELYLSVGREDTADELVRTCRQANPVLAVKAAERRRGTAGALEVAERLASEHPEHAPLLAETARLLRRSGRTSDAMQILGEASEAAKSPVLLNARAQLALERGRPEDVLALIDAHRETLANANWSYILEAQALERMSDLPGSLARAQEGVGRFPGHIGLNQLLWRLLSRLGRQDEAISACLDFAEQWSSNGLAWIQASRFLDQVGTLDAAEKMLEAAGEKTRGHPDYLVAKAQLRMRGKDASGAIDAYEDYIARFGTTLEVAKQTANAEAALGDFDNALARLSPYSGPPHNDPDAKLTAAKISTDAGDIEGAIALLKEVPDSWENCEKQGLKQVIAAEIALDAGDRKTAGAALNLAVRLAPNWETSWLMHAMWRLHSGDVDEAWNSLGKSVQAGGDLDYTGARSLKPMRSLLGQLLNQYRLAAQDEDWAKLAAISPPAEAAAQLKARIDLSPDSLALAIYLFGALRRLGCVTSESSKVAPAPEGAAIPKKLFQFWDSPEMPAQVAAMVDENRRMNPGYEHVRFDLKSAAAYLRDKKEDRAYRGFRLAPHPAAQADILRLAVLWHEGGVYLDVDDRCRLPLDDLIDGRMRFIGYQEHPWMSVGNNFLAVRPRDPVIRAALDDASEAFSESLGESIWIGTGPGAITRALAAHGTKPDGTLQDGIWIMPMHRLRRNIAPHVQLSYKSSDAHWVRRAATRVSATGRERRETDAPSPTAPSA